MSLRARLLAATLVLVSLGMLAADLVTFTALRSFLGDRLDQQIELLSDRAGGRGLPNDPSLAGLFFSLRTLDGAPASPVDTSDRSIVPAIPDVYPAAEDVLPAHFTVRSLDGSRRYRVFARPVVFQGSPVVLITALPFDEVNATLGRLFRIELVVTSAVLVTLGAAAWWLVKLGLRPLEEMEATAEQIAAGDLGRRVKTSDPRTEVGRLGRSLNAMLTQIESAFDARTASENRLRRFIADASHELRTPLTSIRGYAELFRRGAADRPEDLAKAMARIEQEAGRMGVLVDDLLLLARLDQGRPLERRPVDLVRLASDAVDDARAVEPHRPLTLEAPEAGTVTAPGDEARLRQVVGNLLTNVRTHTPPDTPATVRVFVEDDKAVVEVADRGPGVPANEADRVFERFFRADPSRARSSGGTGLGLAIVAAIAEAHGGRAGHAPTPGGGATFRVELPLREPSPLAAPDTPEAHAPAPDTDAPPAEDYFVEETSGR